MVLNFFIDIWILGRNYQVITLTRLYSMLQFKNYFKCSDCEISLKNNFYITSNKIMIINNIVTSFQQGMLPYCHWISGCGCFWLAVNREVYSIIPVKTHDLSPQLATKVLILTNASRDQNPVRSNTFPLMWLRCNTNNLRLDLLNLSTFRKQSEAQFYFLPLSNSRNCCY